MAVLKDYYNTGNGGTSFYIEDDTVRQICQTFTATSAYNVTSIKLKVKKSGTVGNMTILITPTSGGAPSGSSLATCTYDGDTLPASFTWVEFVFDASAPLSSGVKYAIVLTCPNMTTAKVSWGQDVADGTYTGGQTGYSNDGVAWTVPSRPSYPNDDNMFEVWAVGTGELTVTTQSCTGTIAEKSTGHGTLTDSGASAVTQHGHCWATSTDPDTDDSKTTLGAKPNLGQFQSGITGLTPGTTYYVRAYATNGEGTAYGGNVTITTDSTIGRRHWWVEGTEFHYFDESGTERRLEGEGVASGDSGTNWRDVYL